MLVSINLFFRTLTFLRSKKSKLKPNPNKLKKNLFPSPSGDGLLAVGAFGGKWQKQLDGVRSSPFSTQALVLPVCSMGPLSHPPLGYRVLAVWPAKLRCVVKVKYTTAFKDSV